MKLEAAVFSHDALREDCLNTVVDVGTGGKSLVLSLLAQTNCEEAPKAPLVQPRTPVLRPSPSPFDRRAVPPLTLPPAATESWPLTGLAVEKGNSSLPGGAVEQFASDDEGFFWLDGYSEADSEDNDKDDGQGPPLRKRYSSDSTVDSTPASSAWSLQDCRFDTSACASGVNAFCGKRAWCARPTPWMGGLGFAGSTRGFQIPLDVIKGSAAISALEQDCCWGHGHPEQELPLL